MSTNHTSTTSVGERTSEKPKTSSPPTLEFKRLDAACHRGAFSCGDRDIDGWFRNKAWKHHKDLKARVVTAHLLDNQTPVGFYAMTMRLEQDAQLDEEKRFFSRAQGGYFNSVQLCSVAVMRTMQRQGLGTVIMGKALDDFYEVAVRTGIYALTLVAVNKDVAKFYTGLGFVQYGNADALQPKMLLPAASILEARQLS